MAASTLSNQRDIIDDMIFSEGCWLISTENAHSPEIATFRYSFRGFEYTMSVSDWKKGQRKHIFKETT